MNELEATRAKLKCLEMVEGTGLDWWSVVKYMGEIRTKPTDFSRHADEYEFSLGFIEGKPIFSGDVHYDARGIRHIASGKYTQGYLDTCTLNPPAPKTVMVEMLITDVKYYAHERGLTLDEIENMIDRRTVACKKALEQPK